MYVCLHTYVFALIHIGCWHISLLLIIIGISNFTTDVTVTILIKFLVAIM